MNIKFHFLKKTMSWSRLKNLAKSYLSYYLSNYLKKPIIWGYPPVLMIEPTNVCNLKCPLCPSGNGTLTRQKGFMDFDLFTKIIDEVAGKVFMILLWNQGEPFLHPRISEMISYASERGLFILISTNGNTKLDCKRIVASGLDSMIFSLDGADQETYNKYRVNGELGKVLQNVKILAEEKIRQSSSTPLLTWQFIVMRHNEHQLNEIKHLSDVSGADKLQLKTVQIYSAEDVENFLPLNPRYRRYRIKNRDFEMKYNIRNQCKRLWLQPVINWDGEVGVCCFDKDNVFRMGNVGENTFLEIWKSDRYQKFRKKILTSRKTVEICNNCGEGVKLQIK